ncbi:MAG TPA: AI-2E family transporter [Longimicrobiales bacterium]
MNRRPYAVLTAAIFAVLLLLFLHRVAEILLLAFIAILFAIYLSAITDALQRRVAVPRAVGLIIALLVTFIGIAGILWLIVPPVVEQTQGLIEAMPALMAGWETELITLARQSPFWANLLGTLEPGESYTGILVAQIGGYFRGVVPYVFSGITFAIHFISVLVMGMYLSLRPSLYREGFILLAPPVHRELVRDILGDLGRTLKAWIVGQILAMIVLGALTWVGLELLRVPYALAFGVFTGAVAIVPFFGTLFSTLLPALFVLGTGSLMQAFWVVMLGVGVHAFESNVVAPMIMERQVHLPPVLSILAVLVMAHLLHIVGLLVAVPVLCVVMVVGRRVYVHRVLEGKGFRRAIRDRPVELRLPDDSATLIHPAAFETTIPALLER